MKVLFVLHSNSTMFYAVFHIILYTSFIATTYAHAVPTTTTRRELTGGTEPETQTMSTEAIIGVISVVVAIIGIALTLAWSKRRRSGRRSRSRSDSHSSNGN